MTNQKGKKRTALGPASASVTNGKVPPIANANGKNLATSKASPIANANDKNETTPKLLTLATLVAIESHPLKSYGRMLLRKVAQWDDPESDDPLRARSLSNVWKSPQRVGRWSLINLHYVLSFLTMFLEKRGELPELPNTFEEAISFVERCLTEYSAWPRGL